MQERNRQQVNPLKWARSNRNVPVAKISSTHAGVCMPLACIPLFREDAVTGRKRLGEGYQSSRVRVMVEMGATKENLMNKVTLRVSSYVIPQLAFERFQESREELDKSFAKQPGLEGAVIPYIETHDFPAYGTSEFYDALGTHGTPGDDFNTAYLEAYNILWNFRAANRSAKIEPRERLDDTLAPAFWPAGRLEHIVPDFDDAVMEGQFALNVIDGKMEIKGIGLGDAAPKAAAAANTYRQPDGSFMSPGFIASPTSNVVFKTKGGGTAVGDANKLEIWTELGDNGVTASLATMEMAKKAQGFAKLRTNFDGHTEDWIIDKFLMNGVTIPDLHLKQPFQVSDKTVTFEQLARYSSSSGHLTEKAVSGYAELDFAVRVPQLNVGGIFMVIVEILPVQLFERQADPYLIIKDQEEWPEAMRDAADPQKVDIVYNREIDMSHSDPDGLFGFAPKHWKWTSSGPTIGGKFIKHEADDPTNENRLRFWAHEETDPGLTESFWLCQGLSREIFIDEIQHQFEIKAEGNLVINGNTQFGGALVEATDNYDKVMEQMDTSNAKDVVTTP